MARKGANRRQYRRVAATILCRPAGEAFFAQRLEPVDISFGGLRIFSDQEYQVGAVVRLDIFFARATPVTLSAEVMWVKASRKGAPAPFDVGLAFVDLTPQAVSLLGPLFAKEAEPAHPPESKAQPTRAPVRHAIDLDLDMPISEVRAITPKPATVRQGHDPRSMPPKVAVLVAGTEKLRATQLDGRAGFILSLIDGVTTVESLLDLSGMPADETLGILEDLRQRGIIELRPGIQRS